MAIPAIPERDLAKLVLGYLAEEQLMTAYDEFLQSSPYLDALQNEYDRIFMTSLRHIVAEYRAVKIQVETCQPISLRRKLLQCSNLVEIIRFLINNIDVQRLLNTCNSVPKIGPMRVASALPRKVCELCRLKLELCNCKSTTMVSALQQQSSGDSFTTNLDTLVQATALADLPGNHNLLRKKQMKVLDGNCSTHEIASEPEKQNEALVWSHLDGSVQSACNLSMRTMNAVEPRTPGVVKHDTSITNTQPEGNRKTAGGGFQDSTPGVSGSTQVNINVPDSSTTDHSSNINTSTKLDITKHHQSSKKPTSKQPILQYGKNCPLIAPKVAEIRDDQKITIISDIKVNNDIVKMSNVGPIPTTIVINGTPAYKPDFTLNKNYSKDEIMSMPTIILVPHTGPPPTSSTTSIVNATSVTSSCSANSLAPLTIDVADSPTKIVDKPLHVPIAKSVPSSSVEIVKNATMPKETINLLGKTSTPQVQPPARKSSSTPRRSSHVRVLDFATPRRILHENINEHGTHNVNDMEVIVSKSPNLVIEDRMMNHPNRKVNLDPVVAIVSSNSDTSSKENNTISNSAKKPVKNWDADLRALLAGDEEIQSTSPSQRKSTKKKKPPEKSDVVTTAKTEKKNSNKKNSVKKPKQSPRPKSCKKQKVKAENKIVEPPVIVPDNPVIETTVKPTINIVTDWSTSKEEDKSANKSNDTQEDTPDMDRISLQNVIGAKLNISDLLETPYKQALYDIQMETPRFLKPDFPGEPVSDVKICDIPTPRFFDYPVVSQATPSSYSSRPTDYSSGGSYYKPDEQDYQPAPELDYAVRTQAERKVSESSFNEFKSSSKVKRTSDIKRKDDNKQTRPVRQCTKNVSYYDSSSKTSDKKNDADTSSDSLALRIEENENDSEVTDKDKNKVERRRSSNPRSRRSSIKKPTPKKFMKIKPRRPTPTKPQRSRPKKNFNSPNPSKSRRKSNKDMEASTPVTAGPTKSRRKSSTPRKLHKSVYSARSPDNESHEKHNRNKEINKFTAPTTNESDNENEALRWSDEGSRGSHETGIITPSVSGTYKGSNEFEDISKIQEFIASTGKSGNTAKINILEEGGSLHIDLVKRGFDVETAKIIERDLLDVPPSPKACSNSSNKVLKTIISIPSSPDKLDSKDSTTAETKMYNNDYVESKSQITSQLSENDEEEIEEIELSVQECDEESTNYFSCFHNEKVCDETKELLKVKDTYSMEINIEDEVIRLRTSSEVSLFAQSPEHTTFSNEETEAAVNSISGMEKLYTPLKDQKAMVQAQCIEIFDSTLTSLDTPLKDTPKRSELSVTEIVLEVEQIDESAAANKGKKRKRNGSGSASDELHTESKKKKDTRYLPNIQNFDIESVLSKLHGPGKCLGST